MQRRSLLLAAAASLAAPAFASEAYPSRPLQLIVGFAPGGGVDLYARFFARKLEARLGQPVIVLNKPGAGGTIGTGFVAQAKPDGHTLLFTSVAHAINHSFYPQLSFDSLKDFEPIAPVASSYNGIAARADAPFNTLAEMLSYARANPGKLSYGAVSGSTTMYLGMAMFERAARLDLHYVPYNGTMPSVQAAMAGEVDLVSSGFSSSEPFVRAGRLKMLAVTAPQPWALAPGVPTVAQAANLAGFQVANWIGMLAPAGTPKAIVERLNAELKKILDDPETDRFYAAEKNNKFHDTPDNFRRMIAADAERYAPIIKATGAAQR